MIKLVTPLHFAATNKELLNKYEYIYVKNGFACVTNTHIAIKQNLKDCTELTEENIEDLNNKLIHKDIWKEIYKGSWIEVVKNEIHVFYNKKTYVKSVCRIKENEDFPDIDKLFNELKLLKGKFISIQHIRLYEMENIKKAMGLIDEIVHIQFVQKHREIIIKPKNSNQIALLMPVYYKNMDYKDLFI